MVVPDERRALEGSTTGFFAAEVAVKVADDDAGEADDVSAEYDDCAAVAREAGVPVREVMRRAGAR